MRSFFSNLNTRLLVLHFIAFWLFMYGCQMLGFLYDYKFLYFRSELIMRLNYPGRFDADMTFIEQAGNIGLLIAFIISWAISSKRNWHWINATLIFVVLFLLENMLVLRSPRLHGLFLNRGGIFKMYYVWELVTLGVLFVGAGAFILFSKRIAGYITHETEKRKQKETPAKKAVSNTKSGVRTKTKR